MHGVADPGRLAHAACCPACQCALLQPAHAHLPRTCRLTPPARRAFTAAQALVQTAVGWRCAGDLPFCLLLQTMLFVAFNKARAAALCCAALLRATLRCAVL